MRKFLFIIVIALLAVTSVQLWMTKDQTTQKKEIEQVAGQGEAQIGGPFTLIDQTGKTVQDADFRGRLMLVFFGFTHCPDECPMTVTMLSKVMELLGDKADQVAPLFISVDPERDTPPVMKDFLSNFDKRFVGLTGTKEQIRQVAEAYKVYSAKSDKASNTSADYAIDHSAYIYLMGKDGKFIKVLPYNSPDQDVVHAVQNALGQ